MAKPTFQGKFVYYENINGKSKKVEKTFTDQKKFNDFTKKYPMPRFELPKFDLDFGMVDNMKSLFSDFVDMHFPKLFGIPQKLLPKSTLSLPKKAKKKPISKLSAKTISKKKK